ncbi:complement C1q tumor necrosis factor-related protein 3-like [Conger conger]|uniref:complement C1q tumor necrosis factor-related protein 3-like n=1 Tax=Conger conger TaxID=82655 RepID=UPI002A5AD8A1|nr:complement C1q tumor necrosis factor-related protein 3-like [Conger conger]
MVSAVLWVLLWVLGGSEAQRSLPSCQPDIYAQLRELRTQVEAVRIECGDAPVVAFTASLVDAGHGHYGPFNTNAVLVLRNVLTNRGNAYSPTTGLFSAPVAGLYFFSFSSLSAGAQPCGVGLYRNAERVATACDHSAPATAHSAGNAAVLWLKAGDRVSLQLGAGAMAIDDSSLRQTTFTGFLVSLT